MIDTRITVEEINARSLRNMGQTLGIEFTEITEDYIKAKMPVDHRTRQPLGLLNGGASAALAETTGSMGGYLSVDRSKFYCLGLEIKCNHIRSVAEGYVFATAKPAHVGKKTHVWQIETRDEQERLVTLSTLTLAVLEVDENMRQQFKDLFFKQ
ncbi:MAG: hotdog fold thioesterase [Sphingobacteriales bacterium]|nr:MAG: hotdog fold thioesterase [Sphingobacteriales bacterium]